MQEPIRGPDDSESDEEFGSDEVVRISQLDEVMAVLADSVLYGETGGEAGGEEELMDVRGIQLPPDIEADLDRANAPPVGNAPVRRTRSRVLTLSRQARRDARARTVAGMALESDEAPVSPRSHSGPPKVKTHVRSDPGREGDQPPPIAVEPMGRDLSVISDLQRSGVRVLVRDRRFHMVSFPNTLVGSELITWMVATRKAKSRHDAVRLGRLMASRGIIHHCVYEHHFKDEELFYRFFTDIPTPRRRVNRGAVEKLSGNHHTDKGPLAAAEARSTSCATAVGADPLNSISALQRKLLGAPEGMLNEASQVMLMEGILKKRVAKQHPRKRAFFLLSDRVLWAKIRRDGALDWKGAAFLSDVVVSAPASYGFMHGPKEPGFVLQRSNLGKRVDVICATEEEAQEWVTNILLAKSGAVNEVMLEMGEDEGMDRESLLNDVVPQSGTRVAVTELGQCMLDELVGVGLRTLMKTRRYRLRLYPMVVVGSELVSWLVEQGQAKTREEAVAIGRELVEQGALFHCTRGHHFQDAVLFYRVAGWRKMATEVRLEDDEDIQAMLQALDDPQSGLLCSPASKPRRRQ